MKERPDCAGKEAEKAVEDAAPWTFWYWMYGAVSKAGIHADLKGMKEVGLGGCYLMPIRGINDRPEYKGQAQQLTPTFWEMVDYAFQQADSLHLDMGIHVSDGFALAGGPWITPAESMQKVVWTDTIVAISQLNKVVLRRPEAYQGYEEDIAAFALPVWDRSMIQDYKPTAVELSGGMTRDADGTFRASQPGTMVFDLGESRTVRSLRILPSGNNIQSQRLKMKVSVDGRQWIDVIHLEPVRQGWQSTGPAFTYALPTTTARYFRFDWSPEGTEPGAEDLDAAKWKPVFKLKQLILSAEPKINQWEGKTGMAWRVAPSTASAIGSAIGPQVEKGTMHPTDEPMLKLDEVMPLELKDGKVVTRLSRNTWKRPGLGMPRYVRILRFGHTSTGQTNATAGGGKGLEVDKFNKDAVDKQFDAWYGLFLKRPHASVVKYLHIDSWECGTQNWGYRFAEEFRQRRGYDLKPYLLLYAGIPLESTETSERVLKDVRLTMNDLVNERFFRRLEQRAHAVGRRVSQESIAPTFIADGLEHYQFADHPMGEYWLNSPTHDKPNDMLDAVSGAHIYGKTIIQAEGLTEVRGVWDETPATVKPLIDRHLALGMNKLFFHVNAHNPWMDRKPGMTLDGIGFFFQRDNTWYREAIGLVDYVTRCQQWLQKGQPVVDIAVLTGEEMPSRALTPDRLVPLLPGIFGRQRVESETQRLANQGQPMVESPVGVNHAAGILDLKDWTNALHGYQYDSMNKDALLNKATPEGGRLVMPGGNGYRVLVLPGPTKMDPDFRGYSDEVMQKVEAFRKTGGIVVDRPYKEADFSREGLLRDVTLPDSIAYTHRKTEAEDIYFLSNQGTQKQHFTATFRDGRTHAYLYNPLTDQWFEATASTSPQGTDVPLTLTEGEALFVIFTTRPMQVTCKTNIFKTHEQALRGPWKVSFVQTGTTITTDTLFDWSQSTDERIRYYSGYAEYSNQFKWNGGPYKKILLTLNGLKDLAHIYVNGVDCGIVWTAPWQADVTRAIRKGTNNLRIKVVNTWANALRGADEGKAPYDGIWTNAKYRMKAPHLLPAGLLGPVTIEEYETK
ncbi:MAG: DNA-binding protein [Prevotella sp.]|nr:DNA-binding protein [Prevotella sp.]